MTKAEALKLFRDLDVSPRSDVPKRRELWNNFTDYLRCERKITNHQYETWTNPF